MRAYIDSDVLIWHLRGEKKATALLKELASNGEYTLWVGAMQRAEVVFFMRAGEEGPTESFLSQFRTAVVDQRVVDVAGRLYRTWHPSHGIDPNDALLAATVLETGGRIYTRNVKHYPMPGVAVSQAW